MFRITNYQRMNNHDKYIMNQLMEDLKEYFFKNTSYKGSKRNMMIVMIYLHN